MSKNIPIKQIGKYQIISKIGEGSYGTVFKVSDPSNPSIPLVLKRISLQGLSQKERNDFKLEAEILSKLDSKYIVKYYTSFELNNDLNIIMEFCNNGDLNQFIEKKKQAKQPLNEDFIWEIFLKILIGLGYLHKKNILHRDLKTLNIFLTNLLEIKIGDMGVAKILSKNSFARTFVGTPYYLSPEICENKPYNTKSDVWSLGCILYELCTFKHPFNANSQGALILKIIRANYDEIKNENCSEDLKNVIKLMLIKDEFARPSVFDLCCNKIIEEKLKKCGLFEDVVALYGNNYNNNNNNNNNNSNSKNVNMVKIKKREKENKIKINKNRPVSALNSNKKPVIFDKNKKVSNKLNFNNINKMSNEKNKKNKNENLGHFLIPKNANNNKKIIKKNDLNKNIKNVKISNDKKYEQYGNKAINQFEKKFNNNINNNNNNKKPKVVIEKMDYHSNKNKKNQINKNDKKIENKQNDNNKQINNNNIINNNNVGISFYFKNNQDDINDLNKLVKNNFESKDASDFNNNNNNNNNNFNNNNNNDNINKNYENKISSEPLGVTSLNGLLNDYGQSTTLLLNSEVGKQTGEFGVLINENNNEKENKPKEENDLNKIINEFQQSLTNNKDNNKNNNNVNNDNNNDKNYNVNKFDEKSENFNVYSLTGLIDDYEKSIIPNNNNINLESSNKNNLAENNSKENNIENNEIETPNGNENEEFPETNESESNKETGKFHITEKSDNNNNNNEINENSETFKILQATIAPSQFLKQENKTKNNNLSSSSSNTISQNNSVLSEKIEEEEFDDDEDEKVVVENLDNNIEYNDENNNNNNNNKKYLDEINRLNNENLKIKNELKLLIGEKDYDFIMNIYKNSNNENDLDSMYTQIENYSKEKYKDENKYKFDDLYLQLVSNDSQILLLNEKINQNEN